MICQKEGGKLRKVAAKSTGKRFEWVLVGPSSSFPNESVKKNYN